MTASGAPTARTELKRGADRARYERDVILGILEEALYCNVGVALDGQPAMIPTAFAVRGDDLYIHGSTANRILRAMRDGAEACVSVTLLDGLVLARSAFHHSVNYRAVVIYGHAREVVDPAEKQAAFDALIDHIVPGRSEGVRAPNREEFLRTMVLAIPLGEASAKVRSGPPVDEADDYGLDVWAGVLPLRTVAHAPLADDETEGPVPDVVMDRYRALAGDPA
jgi:nitroimidazol reductase NimA-like FMN-containing flavoprotein (pyridoxamine 5'-phosphate oxidase superfamily)